MTRVLLTGTAGFIGFHLAQSLLRAGMTVTGFDGMTDYYDVALKRRRHDILGNFEGFRAVEGLLEDRPVLEEAFAQAQPDLVIHLAAQAGVRYSVERPEAYVGANLVGSFNVLELSRHAKAKHLLMASTSSVYGGNRSLPFVESEATQQPLTLYAATKLAGEAMGHAQAHTWGLPVTMLRFFTVYGPWGRPDMALFKFVRAMLAGEPIDVYGQGLMSRDFTYIDDIVRAVTLLAQGQPPLTGGTGVSPSAPFRVVNIGHGAPVGLLDFVTEIERVLGRPAERNYLPRQIGDVESTYADTSLLQALTGFRPEVSVAEGIPAFVEWYRDYYGV
ncbi:MAG: NAD-dependent epimerase/dehydratase family protein [Rhodospirillales bacterium]